MLFQKPVSEIITQRYSCRSYQARPITADIQQRLQQFINAIHAGPFGAPLRFKLLAATDGDRRSLRSLGTYGFIHGATGFIAGTVGGGQKNLEDFGYQMEMLILAATDLGLDTCWLGGSFTQSSFARKMDAAAGEVVPAVTATGYPVTHSRYSQLVRRQVKADRRLPWESLFFSRDYGVPLSTEIAGPYTQPLEMARLAPSASNKQPWRIVQRADGFHFYLQRTPKYGRGSLVYNLLGLADLQRVDMGIAFCHFELTARELGLTGQWAVINPGLEIPEEGVEYIATWVK